MLKSWGPEPIIQRHASSELSVCIFTKIFTFRSCRKLTEQSRALSGASTMLPSDYLGYCCLTVLQKLHAQHVWQNVDVHFKQENLKIHREVWVVRNPHTLCRPECNCKDLKWHLFWPGPLESSLCSPECSLHHRQYHCWLLAPWGLKRVQHLSGMPFRQTSEGLNIEEHVPRQCSSMLTWSRKKMHGGIGCLHRTARFLGTKRISRS